MDKTEKIKKIKSENEALWLSLPGVVSIGIGYVKSGVPGIIIGVKTINTLLKERIPADIEGIPVVIKIVNELKAF